MMRLFEKLNFVWLTFRWNLSLHSPVGPCWSRRPLAGCPAREIWSQIRINEMLNPFRNVDNWYDKQHTILLKENQKKLFLSGWIVSEPSRRWRQPTRWRHQLRKSRPSSWSPSHPRRHKSLPESCILQSICFLFHFDSLVIKSNPKVSRCSSSIEGVKDALERRWDEHLEKTWISAVVGAAKSPPVPYSAQADWATG